MKHFWFILDSSDPYGVKNVGVTANSIEEARGIAIVELQSLNWIDQSRVIEKTSEIIEDVDIRLLDENQLLPNIGMVEYKGVWWPNLNS